MILVVLCRLCDRRFQWEFTTPALARILDLGFRDMNEYIGIAKESFTCEQCGGWAPEKGAARPI